MDIKSDIAFIILSDGPVSMYHDIKTLDTDLKWFKENNYTVYDFDASNWTIDQAHADIKNEMGFPDYYGRNLNAFNDCLSDTYSTDHKGQVIVFRHFDTFFNKDKEFCLGLLDIIADNSRSWLLTGQRLIGIIQSDDPHFYTDKIGGHSPTWNRKEWLNADRLKK